MNAGPDGADALLLDVLERSKGLGFLGPGPVQRHLDHARGFAALVADLGTRRVVDLGTGGGVPGLVLAVDLPELEAVFVERGRRRCEFLGEAIGVLGVGDRVQVLEMEADRAVRDPALEGWADVVTARSFGPPAVTVEAAVRFLHAGGHLVVSEPPSATTNESVGESGEFPVQPTRWPADGLKKLGMEFVGIHEGVDMGLACLVRRGELDQRFPRRGSTSRKRPIF